MNTKQMTDKATGEVMTATRVWATGAWQISAMYRNQLVWRHYVGYSKREAFAAFSAHLASLN
jgi:hypothetical protein